MTSQEFDNAGDRSLGPVAIIVLVALLVSAGAVGWGMRGRAVAKATTEAFNKGYLKGSDDTLKALVKEGVLKPVEEARPSPSNMTNYNATGISPR